MIPRIRSILYATDLSKNSAYAFRYAVNSAEHHGANIHILHIQGRISDSVEARLQTTSPMEKWEVYDQNKKEEMKKNIKKRLEAFCQREFKHNPAFMDRIASIEVVVGDPTGEILQKADDLKADMVVMGGLMARAFWFTHFGEA